MLTGRQRLIRTWISYDERPEVERLALLRTEAQRLKDHDDPGILLMSGFWAFASDNPEQVLLDNEKSLQDQLARLGRLIDVLGDTVQVVEVNRSVGGEGRALRTRKNK